MVALPALSEAKALELLVGAPSLTYDEVDDIFQAFRFSSVVAIDGKVWYWHDDFPQCGRFPSPTDSDLTYLTGEQRVLIDGMIRCVQYWRQETAGGRL